jgi:hypothetical protein
MDNKRKLELTLCGMLPYGLEVFDALNQTVKVIGIKNQTYFIENGNNYAYADIQDCKPLLHSMEKLTEPILDGGLIPIVELAKIATFENLKWDIQEVQENEYSAKSDFQEFIFNSKNQSFYRTHLMKPKFFENQLELFEKLKEWKFNLYDLPKNMYIELSDYDGK